MTDSRESGTTPPQAIRPNCGEGPWVPYPNRYSVSPERAEEIKADWRRMSAEVKE